MPLWNSADDNAGRPDADRREFGLTWEEFERYLSQLGYVTRDEYELQFSDVFDQIVAYAAGAPINIVNPAVLLRTQLL